MPISLTVAKASSAISDNDLHSHLLRPRIKIRIEKNKGCSAILSSGGSTGLDPLENSSIVPHRLLLKQTNYFSKLEVKKI